MAASVRAQHIRSIPFVLVLGVLGVGLFWAKKRLYPPKKAAVGQKKPVLRVVVTTGMIADAVRQVGKEQVDVQALMGPGVDPHAYRCTPSDMRSLQQADIVFYNGLHLEGQMQTFLEALKGQKRAVYAVGDTLAAEDLLRDPNFSAGIDPHIWHDPRLWKKVVSSVARQLGQHDVKHVALYATNAKRYVQQLGRLHAAIQRQIASIPSSQRVLVTAHDAFGYFGQAYQLEVRALQGISTAAEYGLKDMAALTDFIVKRKIKSIFIETSVPDRPIRALIEGCAKQGHVVTLGGALYSDAMGAAGTPAGTYAGMLQANVQTVVQAMSSR